MALLAILDVEDLATEKIKKTKTALEDLVQTAQKSSAAISKATGGAGAPTNLTQTNQHLTQMIDLLTKSNAAMQTLISSVNALGQAQRNNAPAAERQATAFEEARRQAAALASSLAILTAGFTHYLNEAARLAARIETLGVITQITARNAGYTTKELRVQAEAIKKLGITTEEANDAVLQFVRSNLSLTDAAKLARVAQDLAVVAGKNSSQTYETLTRAIQTSETMLLRQFGIVTTNEQLWQKYAQSIGKTVTQLSAAERQQAFINRIMEEGIKVTGAYEASLTTAGKMLSSMDRLFTTLKERIGAGLLPSFTVLVTGTYNFLEALNKLDPAIMRVVSALGSFLIVMTSLLAIVNTAKWLALVGVFQGLTGPIGLAVAAIAALAAGFAYYNSVTTQTVEVTVQQMSELEATSAVTRKAYEEYSKLTEQGVKLAEAGKKATDEQKALKTATDDLAKAVPTAIESFNTLTNTYTLNEAEIRKVIAANEDLRRSYLSVARAQIGAQEENVRQLEQRRDKLIKDIEQARQDEAYLKSTSDDPLIRGAREAALLRNAPNAAGKLFGAGAVDVATALEEAKKRLAGFGNELAGTVKDLNAANVALKNSQEIIAEFGDDQDPLKRLANLRQGITKGWDEFLSDAKKLGVNISKALVDPTVKGFDWSEYRKNLNGLMSDVDRARTAAAKLQQQYTTAREAADKAMRGDSVAVRAQMDAANAALAAAKEGTEEYEDRVVRAAQAIAQFNKASKETQQRLPALAKAAEYMRNVDLAKWADAASSQLDKLTLSVNEATNTITRKFGEDINQMFRNQEDQFFALREASNDKIYDLDKQAADKRAEQTMDAVDLAIYQEERRVEGIERSLQKEIDARARAQEKAEEQFETRVRMARQEVNDLARNVELQIGLLQEKTEMEIKAAETTFRITHEEAAEKIRAFREESAMYRQRVEEIRLFRNEEITQQAEVGRRQLAQARALNDEIARDQKQALDRQRQASADNIQQIVRDNQIVFRLMRDVSVGLAESVSRGFLDLITQARSSTDVFIGIVRSMSNTVLNIINDMVSQWIRRAALLATTNGGFNVGSFFGGLFGRGGGGAVAAGGAMGPGYGMGGSGAGGNFGGAGSVAGSGVGAAGGSGAMAKVGGGLIVAGTSYYTGALAASKFGRENYLLSGAAGAGAGAATGAAIGSVVPVIGTGVGAGIGAIAGAIGGWLQERKRRKELMAERDKIIAEMGGLDEFKEKAKEAGVALDKFLDTKKSKVYAEELQKIQKAFINLDRTKFIEAQGGLEILVEKAKKAGIELSEGFKRGTSTAADMAKELEKVAKALTLQEAKDGLAKTVTQMDELRKRAVLVGYDLKKLYDAKTIEEFNQEQEKLNKLLEEQQTRLAGLNMAAQGVQLRVVALRQQLEKDFAAVMSVLGEKSAKEFSEAFNKAHDAGYQGGPLKFLIENIDKWKHAMAEATGTQEAMQRAVDRVGGSLAAVFGGILRETGDVMAAFNAVSGSLEELEGIIRDTGVTASRSLTHLLQFRRTIIDNQDVANALSGITQILKGLSDAGRLTAEQFNDLGADAADQWDVLMERGVAADQALLLMQPTLQALYEAQKNFGFATDEATQKLIDMGVANGVVGDQFQSVNQKMLDILVLIAEVLGADIPEAYRRQQEAANNAAQAAEGANTDAANAAQDAAEQQQNAADAAAQAGEKVGDLSDEVRDYQDYVDRQEWTKPYVQVENAVGDVEDQFGDATTAVRTFADTAVEELRRVEEAANAISFGRSPGGLKEIPIKAQEAAEAFYAMRRAAETDLGDIEARVNAVSDPTAHDQRERSYPIDRAPRREPEPEEGGQVVVKNEVHVEFTSIDPSQGAAVWDEHIRPRLLRDLENNNHQIASRMSRATRRY